MNYTIFTQFRSFQKSVYFFLGNHDAIYSIPCTPPPPKKLMYLASKKIQALYAKVLNLHYFGLHGEVAESGQAVRTGTGNVYCSVTALIRECSKLLIF